MKFETAIKVVHFKKVCGCEKGGLYEARIFEQGSYEGRDKWDGSFNVHIQGEKAYISMLDRGWSRRVNDHVEAFCKGNGVNRVAWERRGKTLERRI